MKNVLIYNEITELHFDKPIKSAVKYNYKYILV